MQTQILVCSPVLRILVISRIGRVSLVKFTVLLMKKHTVKQFLILIVKMFSIITLFSNKETPIMRYHSTSFLIWLMKNSEALRESIIQISETPLNKPQSLPSRLMMISKSQPCLPPWTIEASRESTMSAKSEIKAIAVPVGHSPPPNSMSPWLDSKGSVSQIYLLMLLSSALTIIGGWMDKMDAKEVFLHMLMVFLPQGGFL